MNRRRGPIDRTARENFVYWIYDAEGRVLYIGMTRNLDGRWKAHAQVNPGLVAAAVRCKVRGPYLWDDARRIEHAAIRAENPLFNLEVDGHQKRDAIIRLIEKARRAAQLAVLDRYGIEIPDSEAAS